MLERLAVITFQKSVTTDTSDAFLIENNLASVYERHNESLIIPSLKTAFKILAARWFYYRALLLKRHKRSEAIFAFAVGVSGLALNKVTKWEFITVVKKCPLCILA